VARLALPALPLPPILTADYIALAPTRLYRIGANNIGVAVNGAKVLDVATTGLAVTGTLASSGAISQNGFALLPVGLGPLPWSGTSAPSGWVLCYGQALSRATYAALWAFAQTEIAASNTLFTNGDGSTTFTVPDMRGRIPGGQDDMGGSAASRLTSTYFGTSAAALGATGGAQNRTLAANQIPTLTGIAGTNSITVQSTNYLLGNTTTNSGSAQGGGTQLTASDPGSGAVIARQNSSGSNAITVSYTNGSQADVATIQPTIITNYIIFAVV
jgi:microcystin-dependent protein